MSDIDTPAYFCLTDRVDVPPAPDDCIEGRLFLDDERLLCGAGKKSMQEGYVGRVDDHAGSTVRRLFGGVSGGFQRFSAEEAQQRDRSRSLPLSSLTSVELLTWEGSDLAGADQTYGIRVTAPGLGRESLVVQLGKGWRNRGSGRRRHAALVDALDAMSGAAGTPTAAGTPPTSHTENTPQQPRVAGSESGAEPESGEPTWLTNDETALVVRNDTERMVSARIGCRVGEETHFAEDVRLASRDRQEWTDLPTDSAFEVGVVPKHGTGTAATVEDIDAVDGDIRVYLTPEEATIDIPIEDSAETATPPQQSAGTPRQQTTETPPQQTAAAPAQGAAGTSPQQSAGTPPQPPQSTDTATSTTTDGQTDRSEPTDNRPQYLAIALVGIVAWFGSPVVGSGQTQEILALGGAAITLYGVLKVALGGP